MLNGLFALLDLFEQSVTTTAEWSGALPRQFQLLSSHLVVPVI
jgi:hypothetical protein